MHKWFFFGGNTANKTEQRKQIERKRGSVRGGEEEEGQQHSMFCRGMEGGWPPSQFHFHYKYFHLCAVSFSWRFSHPSAERWETFLLAPYTHRKLIIIYDYNKNNKKNKCFAYVRKRFVSFGFVIETIVEISKTEQKADRYNKCNICPIETLLHSKEAGE